MKHILWLLENIKSDGFLQTYEKKTKKFKEDICQVT